MERAIQIQRTMLNAASAASAPIQSLSFRWTGATRMQPTGKRTITIVQREANARVFRSIQPGAACHKQLPRSRQSVGLASYLPDCYNPQLDVGHFQSARTGSETGARVSPCA